MHGKWMGLGTVNMILIRIELHINLVFGGTVNRRLSVLYNIKLNKGFFPVSLIEEFSNSRLSLLIRLYIHLFYYTN